MLLNLWNIVSLTSMLQLYVCKLGLAQINTLYNFQYLFKFELFHIVSRLRKWFNLFPIISNLIQQKYFFFIKSILSLS